MVYGLTTLVILGLSCLICEFLVKFFAVYVFVNLSLPYFGVCEFGSSLFSGRGGTMRGGAVQEGGGISCPDHRGEAGSSIDGTCAGFGSPMIKSRSASLPSLGKVGLEFFLHFFPGTNRICR